MENLLIKAEKEYKFNLIMAKLDRIQKMIDDKKCNPIIRFINKILN